MTSLEISLTARVAELEAELANRPVVWAIEHIQDKTLVKKFGAVMLFQTKEDIEEYISAGFERPYKYHAVVYTGVARWFDNSSQEDPPPIVLSPLLHIELTLVIPTTKESSVVGTIVTVEDEEDE